MGEARRKAQTRKALEVICPRCSQPAGAYCQENGEGVPVHLSRVATAGPAEPFKRRTVYRVDDRPKEPIVASPATRMALGLGAALGRYARL